MSTTETPTRLHIELHERLEEARHRHGVPGAAVGIHAGGIDHVAVAGVTSVENPLPIDETTLFQIGSTTKTYTGSAVMALVDQGRVALDDRVTVHVPDLQLRDADTQREVTILHLLNHTSGWAGDVFDSTGDGDDALARLVHTMRDFPQHFPLGTQFSYNNVAVSVAGHVIEKVTGTTYEQAIRALLLAPLGMRQSWFSLNDVATRRFVVGHANKEDQAEVIRPVSMARNANPAGGLWSTVSDQLRWARLHMGDGTADDGTRVLSAEAVRLMQTPTVRVPTPGTVSHLGISWFLNDREGGRTVEHGGNTLGQNHGFVMVPARHTAISVMTNSQPNGSRLEQEIVDWFLEEYAGISKPSDPEPLDLSGEQLGEYAGRYATDAVVLTLEVDGDHLVVRTEVMPHVVKALLDEGKELPVQPPLAIRITAGDGAVVTGGEGDGMQFQFARRDGRVSGLDAGGRFAARQD